eukprot:g1959.t1
MENSNDRFYVSSPEQPRRVGMTHRRICTDTESRQHEGSISLIVGPMFSGKSTELLRRVGRFKYARKKCLYVKYKADQRYSNKLLSTHDRQMVEAISCSTLDQVPLELLKKTDVIGIDEGQFFPDLLTFTEKCANEFGLVVVIAALDGDYLRKPFNHIHELLPKAENVTKLKAVCAGCGRSASFTKRLVASDKLELIGGAESYKPTCRKCYFAAPSKKLPFDSPLRESNDATNVNHLASTNVTKKRTTSSSTEASATTTTVTQNQQDSLNKENEAPKKENVETNDKKRKFAFASKEHVSLGKRIAPCMNATAPASMLAQCLTNSTIPVVKTSVTKAA